MYLVDAESAFRKPTITRQTAERSTPPTIPAAPITIWSRPCWPPRPELPAQRGKKRVSRPSYPYLNSDQLDERAREISESYARVVAARWAAANTPPFPRYEMPSGSSVKRSWDDARWAGKIHCPPHPPAWALFDGAIPYEPEPETPRSPAMAMEDDRRLVLLANRDRLRAEREARGIGLVRWHGAASAASKKKDLPLAEWDSLALRARTDDRAFNDIAAAAFPIAQELAQRLLPDRKVGGAIHVDELRDDLTFVGIYGTAAGDRTTGIWLAIDQWDPAKGGSFRAFMRRAMRQRMVDHCRAHVKRRINIDSVDAPMGGGDDD
jgi:hypothetical protein